MLPFLFSNQLLDILILLSYIIDKDVNSFIAVNDFRNEDRVAVSFHQTFDPIKEGLQLTAVVSF